MIGVYLLPGKMACKTIVCLTSTFQNIIQSGLEMGDFQTLGEEEGRKVKIVTKNVSIIQYCPPNTVNLDIHFTLRRYVGILLKSTGNFKRNRAENSPVCGRKGNTSETWCLKQNHKLNILRMKY